MNKRYDPLAYAEAYHASGLRARAWNCLVNAGYLRPLLDKKFASVKGAVATIGDHHFLGMRNVGKVTLAELRRWQETAEKAEASRMSPYPIVHVQFSEHADQAAMTVALVAPARDEKELLACAELLALELVAKAPPAFVRELRLALEKVSQ